MKRKAECACGQLSLTTEGTPAQVVLCHCLECQKQTGSALNVAACFPDDQVKEYRGESSVFERTGDQGALMQFHFCPSCGGTVYWSSPGFPNLCMVAVGCFADPTFPAPTLESHTSRRHHWMVPVSGAVGHEMAIR